jgi:uncharacterized membrane protein
MELWPTRSELEPVQRDPRPGRLERLLLGLILAALLALSATWWVRTLVHRNTIYGMRSVVGLGALEIPTYGQLIAGAYLAAFLAIAFRRPALILRLEALAILFFALIFTIIGTLFLPFGWHASLSALTLCGALFVGLHVDRLPPLPRIPYLADRTVAAALWALTALVFSIFSMHRHSWFGSGSWDMGCMVHNVYRASRFLDSTSTVLGNVDYLGDHFMIGIYLLAPFFWISSSGYMLLFVQSASLAATVPALFLIARTRNVEPLHAIVLAIAAGFSFGIQSAVYFDSHEIALGIGFLAFALWAFEARRFLLATVLLAVFALFKESLGAYLAGLGLFAILRGALARDRTQVKYGALWILIGGAWFVLVNRVFMPALIARANPPEPHETFADFGPTVFEAALNMAAHPLKAVGALFVPEEKLWSLIVTFGGLGYVAFASPEITLAALPLLAERFFSSKSTMWEMGYHYAAPLSIYAGWAAAIGWPRVLRFASRFLGERAPLVLLLFVAAQTEATNTIGYRHPSNFHHWIDDYFSKPERREANRRAVDFLGEQGREQKLAVQNRILPHLADRPYIYRLGDWSSADWVLLSLGESAWPYDDGLPFRVMQQLAQSPDWRLVFSEGTTAVFARVTAAVAANVPAVKASPELHLTN